MSGEAVGLLLAAGAGRRMGRPKALVPGWLEGGVRALLDGGVDRVVVVLGAAPEALELLPEPLRAGPVSAVLAQDWGQGMGASLRTGLTALRQATGQRAVIHLVDLPDVGAPVVARLLAREALEGLGPAGLARAAYDARPGHPVLLGRDHWPGVARAARGDRGARDYLQAHRPLLVECGDLATGLDVDRPPTSGQRCPK